MSGRIFHLFRRELHSHRWILTAFVIVQLILTAACIGTVVSVSCLQSGDTLNLHSWFQVFIGKLWETGYALDLWTPIIAGLVAAWIALSDPLQSPTAFWPTRPARLGEVVLAKALVCAVVLVLFPACCGTLAAWLDDFSVRDVMLSGASFPITKAGWVPVGFTVGLLLPAPGKRLLALLLPLGWWLGSATWSSVNIAKRTDYDDQSLTFALIWLFALASLPLLLRWRRAWTAQIALAILAFSAPWITGTLKPKLATLPTSSPQSLGMSTVEVTAAPKIYHFSEEREGPTPKLAVVELQLNSQGLPEGVMARAIGIRFDVEPESASPPFQQKWRGWSTLTQSWYDAVAHAIGAKPEQFPKEWHWDEEGAELELPYKTLTAWNDDQVLNISGKVTLRLYHVEKQWEGVATGDNFWLNRNMRRHGAYLALNTGPNYFSVETTQPEIAELWAKNDLSAKGGIFNDEFAAWNIAFQPPVKETNGQFSNTARRDPPLWALCKRGNERANTMVWLRRFGSSLDLSNAHAPELLRPCKVTHGMKDLPIALVTRVAYAEVEVPLLPLRVTKRQILETRQITLAKP